MTVDGGSGRRGGVAGRVPSALLSAAAVSGCALLVAAAVLLVGWVLLQVAPVTLAVVAALLLAALLSPMTDGLRRARLPPALAALATVLLLLAVLVLPMVLVGQRAAAQFGDLGARLGEGVGRVRQMLLDGPLPINEGQLDDLWRQAGDAAVAALPGPASGAAVAAETLGAAALALVLLFFLLKDGPQMWHWLLRLAPRRRRHRVDAAARAGWDALTGYVRGTVVIAATDAVGIGVALLVLDVPLALPLALLTFVAAFVPIVGATVAGVAAVLVALVANGPTDALLVLAAVIVVQQVEGNLLAPLVMGRAVRLHPAVILTAVGAGTVLAGVAGAVVAVPLTAVGYRVVDALAAGAGPAHGQPAGDDGDGQRDQADDEQPLQRLEDQAQHEQGHRDDDRGEGKRTHGAPSVG